MRTALCVFGPWSLFSSVSGQTPHLAGAAIAITDANAYWVTFWEITNTVRNVCGCSIVLAGLVTFQVV